MDIALGSPRFGTFLTVRVVKLSLLAHDGLYIVCHLFVEGGGEPYVAISLFNGISRGARLDGGD